MRLNWRRGYARWSIAVSALSVLAPLVMFQMDPQTEQQDWPSWFFRWQHPDQDAIHAGIVKKREARRAQVSAAPPTRLYTIQEAQARAKERDTPWTAELEAKLFASGRIVDPRRAPYDVLSLEARNIVDKEDSLAVVQELTATARERIRWNYAILGLAPLAMFVTLWAAFALVVFVIRLNKWVVSGFRGG